MVSYAVYKRLGACPSAPLARYNAPRRRTISEMVRGLPADAVLWKPFRTASGRPANAFLEYQTAGGRRVARYHETDILTIEPDGSVKITFGGWHTLSTRARFNVAAETFGLPLRASACGKVWASRIWNARHPSGKWKEVAVLASDDVLTLVPADWQ